MTTIPNQTATSLINRDHHWSSQPFMTTNLPHRIYWRIPGARATSDATATSRQHDDDTSMLFYTYLLRTITLLPRCYGEDRYINRTIVGTEGK